MIPAMTDPMGRYWDQPGDIRDAPMDEKTVLLTPRQFHELNDYSASMPSGVYVGKCWKRARYDAPPWQGGKVIGWLLGWYGPDEPGYCSNNWREIAVVEDDAPLANST